MSHQLSGRGEGASAKPDRIHTVSVVTTERPRFRAVPPEVRGGHAGPRLVHNQAGRQVLPRFNHISNKVIIKQYLVLKVYTGNKMSSQRKI